MNKIRELRNSIGLKQTDLCRMLGVTQGALSGWENNKYEPDIKSLKKMAAIFKCSVDYLLGNDSPSTDQGRGVKIPVLGNVAAGLPCEAVEDILDYEEITPEMASQGEYFALQIKGHSMEPKFSPGDVVIVRKQSDVDSGDIAIVLVNGDEATVKKITKRTDGVVLVPTNPSYETMFYSNKEIEDLPVVILGKVVELRAKF